MKRLFLFTLSLLLLLTMLVGCAEKVPASDAPSSEAEGEVTTPPVTSSPEEITAEALSYISAKVCEDEGWEQFEIIQIIADRCECEEADKALMIRGSRYAGDKYTVSYTIDGKQFSSLTDIHNSYYLYNVEDFGDYRPNLKPEAFEIIKQILG